ncbi:putative ATPase [Paraburkholderia phenoliruptrix]|uniref:ATP-binding protein n=1 Tax=Paraburkholderia phenoliruptrix TaxID=252970 RepID=UPI0028580035|nr:ATP-binding protein [Paraburkholderia phenoliruptrix]MDR6420508.1 putative ATPase [Paraburkholderia phenoliruptrix]
MLLTYTSQIGRYEFVKDGQYSDSTANSYTIIVGKNGTGKSRLLRAVVLALFEEEIREELVDRSDRAELRQLAFELDTARDPTQVICVATSPFDRFPLLRRNQNISGYTYLGMRGLSSANQSLAYLSKIANTLVDSVLSDERQAGAIAGVLNYLGYEPSIGLSWQLLSSRLIDELSQTDDPRAAANELIRRGPAIFHNEMVSNYQRIIDTPSYKLRYALELARHVQSEKRSRFVELHLGQDGFTTENYYGIKLEDIFLLISTGLLRLRQVELCKSGSDAGFLISHASSGEQAVVLSLLGIGSQIRDGSLVCIDEPEVCLHPEWQEKYIQLLYSTFQHFTGCHFVIATHSPQIVAHLPEGNCHIMSMETGLATDASSFSRKSIDFQLAEVFGAPGVRNEYLSRIALNLFASVSKVRRFDADALKTLKSLENVVELLQKDDPIYDLIMALKEMRKNYA